MIFTNIVKPSTHLNSKERPFKVEPERDFLKRVAKCNFCVVAYDKCKENMFTIFYFFKKPLTQNVFISKKVYSR